MGRCSTRVLLAAQYRSRPPWCCCLLPPRALLLLLCTASVAAVDAEVQVDLGPHSRQQLLQLDSLAPHAEALAAASGALADAAAGEQQQQQRLDALSMHQQGAAVLAGVASWLPSELVAAAEAAAAAAAAAPADSAAGGAEAAAAAAAAAALAGGSGAELWAEEARLAGSIMSLVPQLEASWTLLADQLAALQVRQQWPCMRWLAAGCL